MYEGVGRDKRGVPKGVKDPDYLGDGVYCGHDGNGVLVVWLVHPGSLGPDAIALEPQVMSALVRYRQRLSLRGLL
jgi:hypothetical protein